MKTHKGIEQLVMKHLNTKGFFSWVVPFPYLLGGLCNILLYYVGLNFQNNIPRQVFFTGTTSLFFLFSLCWAFWLMKKKGFSWKFMLRLGMVPLLLCICVIASLLNNGINMDTVRWAASVLVFSISAFIAGAYSSLYKQEVSFFTVIERWSVFFLPAALEYTISSFFAQSRFVNSGGLGIINYMSLSYIFLPAMMASTILYAKDDSGYAGIINGKKGRRIRFCVITLLWAAIVFTGTRGAILCGVFFLLCLTIFCLIIKHPVKQAVILCCSSITILILILFVHTQLATQFGVQGQSSRVIASITSNTRSYEFDIGRPSDNPPTEAAQDISVVDNTEYSVFREMDKLINSSAPVTDEYRYTRLSLYYLALGEIRKNPLTGMGPFGFQVKYRYDPHNFILELLAELGVFIGGIAILFIALLCLRLVKKAKKDVSMGFFLIFIFGFIPCIMISISFWQSPYLMFPIGYALFYGTPNVASS